jgi:hypothetical protein
LISSGDTTSEFFTHSHADCMSLMLGGSCKMCLEADCSSICSSLWFWRSYNI